MELNMAEHMQLSENSTRPTLTVSVHLNADKKLLLIHCFLNNKKTNIHCHFRIMNLRY